MDLRSHGIKGVLSVETGARSVLLLEYRAGEMLCRTRGGQFVTGPPTAFKSDDGDNGVELLSRLIIPPKVDQVHYGMFREVLANASLGARVGFVETHDFDDDGTYVTDAGGTSVGVVRILRRGAVGAFVSGDPSRELDIDAQLCAVPEESKRPLLDLLALPLLNSSHQFPVSAVVWADSGRFASAEPWYQTYAYGAEMLCFEAMLDDEWVREVQESHELSATTADLILRLARRRFDTAGPISVGLELAELLPEGSIERAEAISRAAAAGFLT